MSIIRINTPMIPQSTDGTCWYASLCMLAEWRKGAKGGLGGMIDPQVQTDCQFRVNNNMDWDGDDIPLLKKWLNVNTRSDITMDFDSVNQVLGESGPIWVGGVKSWGGAPHGHVIVICGVADTGVLIHDPEPMNVGSEQWKTWSSIRKFVNDGGFDPAFVTCP